MVLNHKKKIYKKYLSEHSTCMPDIPGPMHKVQH